MFLPPPPPYPDAEIVRTLDGFYQRMGLHPGDSRDYRLFLDVFVRPMMEDIGRVVMEHRYNISPSLLLFTMNALEDAE